MYEQKGSGGVKYDSIFYDSEENRQKRQHRRKVREDWRAYVKSIQAADPNRKMLLREARREGIAIKEDGARTQEQFEEVLMLWDDLEYVEKWRRDKQEEKYSEDLQDKELSDRGVVIPQPLNHVYWRQLLSGSFIDTIQDCPHEIHETTTSRPVRDFTMELDESHKEILYYRAIRLWSPQKIAALRDQTDRNIRKVYSNMIAGIRKKMYERLYFRHHAKLPLTHTQREFMENYWEQLDETKQARMTSKFENELRRRRIAGETLDDYDDSL